MIELQPRDFIRAFRLATAIVTVGVLCTCLGLASGAEAAPVGAMPFPQKSFVIGNVHFDQYGPLVDPSPALILIPGLSMGSWEWQSTISAFATDHTVYAATLAGFDGTQPASGPYLPQADAAIAQLVRKGNLKAPILVGHSIGGHLALRLVEEHPDMFGGAVIVDETPYFPPLAAGQTVQQRAQNVADLAEGIQSAPDWIYDDQTRSMAATMVTDPAQADDVAQHSLRSDRATLAGATSEMSLDDLRPALGRITVPVLVIAPVSSQAPYMTDQLRALTPDQLTATIRNYYASQYDGAKTVTVQTIANSKDFVMLDQPDALNAAIRNFLVGLQPHM